MYCSNCSCLTFKAVNLSNIIITYKHYELSVLKFKMKYFYIFESDMEDSTELPVASFNSYLLNLSPGLTRNLTITNEISTIHKSLRKFLSIICSQICALFGSERQSLNKKSSHILILLIVYVYLFFVFTIILKQPVSSITEHRHLSMTSTCCVQFVVILFKSPVHRVGERPLFLMGSCLGLYSTILLVHLSLFTRAMCSVQFHFKWATPSTTSPWFLAYFII